MTPSSHGNNLFFKCVEDPIFNFLPVPLSAMLSMMSEPAADFNYLLARKDSLLVVTFTGSMSLSAVAKLQECKKEIESQRDLHFVVLYFRDVQSIDDKAVPILSQIQTHLRSRPAAVSICSLRPELRDQLMRVGAIRKVETSDNLQAALKSFKLTGQN